MRCGQSRACRMEIQFFHGAAVVQKRLFINVIKSTRMFPVMVCQYIHNGNHDHHGDISFHAGIFKCNGYARER